MQLIGAILICLSFASIFVCKLTKRNDKYVEWISLAFLVGVAWLDIPLYGGGEQTITQFIQLTIRQAAGIGIMLAYVLSIGFLFGTKKMLPTIHGCILGHLFWSS